MTRVEHSQVQTLQIKYLYMRRSNNCKENQVDIERDTKTTEIHKENQLTNSLSSNLFLSFRKKTKEKRAKLHFT